MEYKASIIHLKLHKNNSLIKWLTVQNSMYKKIHGLWSISSIRAQCLLILEAYRQSSVAALCVVTNIAPLKLHIKRMAIAGSIIRPVDDYNPYNNQPRIATKYIIPIHTQLKCADDSNHLEVSINTDGSKTN